MVFTLSKELIQDVIEKKRNNVVHEEIIVKDNSEEKYILKYNKILLIGWRIYNNYGFPIIALGGFTF